MRSLVWPREHGAWGILLVPLATGAAVGLETGRGFFPLLLFTLAALALFCLRVPVEVLLETTPLRAQNPAERRTVLSYLCFFAAIATASLVLLFWKEHAYGLLLLGAAAAITFGAQAALRQLGRDTRMSSQLVGAIGLTSTAAGACYVAAGQLDIRALVLWAANWLFAANQIHYVQLRIRAARAASRSEKFVRGWVFLLGEAATALLVVLAWRFAVLPGWATLAFAPVLLRGAAWFLRPQTPLQVHRLGKQELVYAILFGLLLILALLLG
ncbi:MAG TPA: YwiC-like family protein [Terriglobales bacterium]|nr:YwiC-like family protein [Terriglobales bacterium]